MYIDTANLSEIEKALATGVIQGVTTNPTILKRENKSRLEQIEEIMALEPKILFVQLVGNNKGDLLADFDSLWQLKREKNYNLGIKVPINMIGLEVVKAIKDFAPDCKILGTVIYSADQVILASLAGCDMVAPYVNRMQNNSIDAYAEIAKMRNFIDDRKLKTEILAASFKNTAQVSDALYYGADSCTLPYAIFEQMVNKDTAMKATAVFNQDALVTEL